VANFTVVYDACLLYPASIRDLAVELARTGLLRAKWTTRIHAEWINALIRQRPELDRARLERVAALMNSGVTDCLVTGFESLEAGLTELPDPDDRHVLAAAIHSGAQEIVTFKSPRLSRHCVAPLWHSSRSSRRLCRASPRSQSRGRV
jgi:predicted nucleic acid-binding protein